jgi:hypothetical protein
MPALAGRPGVLHGHDMIDLHQHADLLPLDEMHRLTVIGIIEIAVLHAKVRTLGWR